MRAVDILRQKLCSTLSFIHIKRLNALYWAVGVLTFGKKLTLTGLGRAARGPVFTKHNIKRVDRLLGNPHLYKQQQQIYRSLAHFLLRKMARPVLLVDWTKIGADHAAIVASLPTDGRAVTLYQEVHPLRKNNSQQAHEAFLQNLSEVLPANCRPILVTDAGFKNPWFKEVRKHGWDHIGRILNTVKARQLDSNKWQFAAHFSRHARRKPSDLGQWVLAQKNPLVVRFVVGAALSARKKLPKRKHRYSSTQDKARRRARDPWVLATSLQKAPAKQIVRAYSRRMQIEETFRDAKNHRFGWSFEDARSKSKKRLGILLLIAALAMLALTLLGQATEDQGLHKRYQANTITNRRVLSLFVLGMQIVQLAHHLDLKQADLTRSIERIRGKFECFQE